MSLAWNGLGDEACDAIADCLKNNHVLLQLDIANNRISRQGALIIAKGMDANETLKVFKVRDDAEMFPLIKMGKSSERHEGLIHWPLSMRS